jgi:peptide deformylase
MIYPIIAYGDPVLRQKAKAIETGTDVKQLAEDMLATMDLAEGVGLAAPQIGKSIRLFVVNLSFYLKEEDNNQAHRKVLINPILTIDEATLPSTYQEGCLSIPNILVEVPRKESITISYFDVNWQLHQEQWTGFPARVMQHEYDHLEGKLHIDYAPPLRKRLFMSKLHAISQGKIEVAYKMLFPIKK